MDKNFISLGWFRGEEKPDPKICQIIVVQIISKFSSYSYGNSGFLLCYYDNNLSSWIFLDRNKKEVVVCSDPNIYWVEKWTYLF